MMARWQEQTVVCAARNSICVLPFSSLLDGYIFMLKSRQVRNSLFSLPSFLFCLFGGRQI